MSYSLVFSPEAQQDIIETIHWYNDQKENLGFDFYSSLNEKLEHVSKNPLHFPIKFKNVRASKTRVFPYMIYFKIDDAKSIISILGILHTSRNPNTIKKRK